MHSGLQAYEILELPLCRTSTVFAGRTRTCFSSMIDPPASRAIRFVCPKPLPEMTIELLFLSIATSAIIGLPMMRVGAPAGSLAILALSSVTAIRSVSARAGDAPKARTNAAASQRRDDMRTLSRPEIRAHFAHQR